MPKPAARVADLTDHGGTIQLPGCPRVLINGRAAARITDAQLCPLFDGPKPHTGGIIQGPGYPKILIGGLPAAGVDDITICVGPPGKIVTGSQNVLLGDL